MADPIKLPSGRWEVRYRDPGGRPGRRRFDTKGAANDHLAKTRTQGVEGTYIAPEHGRITFDRWADTWWQTKVDLRARTLARYERDLRLHIRPRFGSRQLAKITRAERAGLGRRDEGGQGAGLGHPSAILRPPQDHGRRCSR